MCGYSFSEARCWMDMSSYYKCEICGKETTIIPGTILNVSLYTNANVASLNLDDEAVTIDTNTVICRLDGQYYLVKSQTETEALASLMQSNKTTS